MHNFKYHFILTSLSLIILSSCSNESATDLNLVFNNTISSQSVKSSSDINRIESDLVAKQIKDFSISNTEWGNQVKQLPVTRRTKKTTLLSYIAYDNDKGSVNSRNELPSVLNMHELAGSSKDINQVLLTDGLDNQDTKRYYIINNLNKQKIASPYVLSKHEKDTGSYITLAAFIKWGFSNYPSKTKILDINNHGGAYEGIAADWTSGRIISVPDLAKAIQRGVGKLDLLIMDACLMSSVEVAYELRNSVDFIVSSEDYTLNTGMQYVKYLPEILAKSKDNNSIAQNIMDLSDRLGESYENYGNEGIKVPNVFTLSSVKASDMDRLVYHLNKLSRMLLNKMPDYKNNLKTAFDQTHKFALEDEGQDSGQRDLHEILARIERNIPEKETEIRNVIQDAREAANRAIVRARIHKSEKFAEGFALNISNSVNTEKYKATSFARDTLWDEFVNKVNQ